MRKQLTVLFLISSEGYYGAENMLVTLARNLSQQGCRCVVGVFVNSHSPHTEVGEQAIRYGLIVEYVPCHGKWDRNALANIRLLIVRHNVDIVHAHGYKADLYAYAAAPSGVKLFATSHNWTGTGLKMRAYAVVDRLVLARFDRVVVVSEAVGALLRKWGVKPDKLSTICNGADLERYRDAAPALRNEMAVGSQRIVGFIGRLVTDKGGAVLIRAASKVLSHEPDTHFVFVGDGPERKTWEALAGKLGIAEHVWFAGVRADMPAVYASLDMLVLPSFIEALPMCLLEAMAAGTPVIAARVGAIPRLITSRETGVLVLPGDEDGCANAILYLLRDPAMAAELGKSGQAHVGRHFSAGDMAKSYLQQYQQVLHDRGVPCMSASAARQIPRIALTISETQPVKVSIIAACRNEITHIHAFLDSLLAQEMNSMTWEAVIADGMSDDGTLEVLQQFAAEHAQLRVISNPDRIVSTGLNAGIRAARGAIIIRFDAHTLYARDYCRRCVDELESSGADNVGGPARTAATGIRARAVAAAYHSRFSTGGAKFHDVTYQGWVDTVPYGCWRKATFEKIGLFDEALVRNQDDELNLRLRRAGGRIWQSPSIVSWYTPRSSLSSLFKQYFQYGFWKVAVIRKHLLPASWRHVVPIIFILINILLLTATGVTLALGDRKGFTMVFSLWSCIFGLYLLSLCTASFSTARHGGWATLPHLPAIFVAFHLSYGLGFLVGLRWYVTKVKAANQLSQVFTQISRTPS